MTMDEAVVVGERVNKTKGVVIVELGAHRGEESSVFDSWMYYGFKNTHIMVEPDPDNCFFIRQYMAKKEVCERLLIEAAIGKTFGQRTFYRSLDSRDGLRGSGSILEPTGHKTHFPTISFEPIQVVCYTLDEIFEEQKLDRIDLLWMDVQGAEAEVIQGGQKALEKTKYCFLEAEEVEFYKEQVLKRDLMKMLPGWSLIKDFGYNLFMKNEQESKRQIGV